ncbi:SMI1/KNR4 family protein [Streptomyces sp. NPDC008121]|uniref:SMI1/KNR4 family protein n=1 Tax=Streptomyces sp. NPDC008121 TaxID=3364809 RepID=UPI0036EDC004
MPLELPDDIGRSVSQATGITAPGVTALLDYLGGLASEHATQEQDVNRSAALEAASAVYVRAAGATRAAADRPGTHATESVLAVVREADQLVYSAMREYDAHAILSHLAAGSDDVHPSAPDRRLRQPAARQVTDTWQRIATWLEVNAPATHAALLPGAARRDVDALERELWVPVPVELRALWALCAGDRDVQGAGWVPDHGWALMPLDSVRRVYVRQSRWQREHEGEGWLWKPSWIPFASWSVTDVSAGLFVDAETSEVGQWDDTAVRTVWDKSLTEVLEEIADTLEHPQLAVGYQPGLIGDRLVWGPPLAADEAELWRPFPG